MRSSNVVTRSVTGAKMQEQKYYLPYDYSRCDGSKQNGELHKLCQGCLRKLAPGNPIRQSYIDGKVKDDLCTSFIGVPC